MAVAITEAMVECPGHCGLWHFATLNHDAPIPNPPATVHDDEGRPVAYCPRCSAGLDARELLGVDQ